MSMIFQLAVFVAIMFVPVAWAPWYVVAMFRYTLLALEPLLMMMDVVQVVVIAGACTNILRTKVEEDSDVVWVWKALLVFGSGACYLLSYYFLFLISVGDFTSFKWIALMTILVLVVLHYFMYHSDQGALSDVAGVTACSMLLIHMMYTDKPPAIRSTLTDETSGAAYLSFIQMAFTKNLSTIHAGVAFIKHLLSPSVIIMCVLRVCSLKAFISTITDYLVNKDELDDMIPDRDIHQPLNLNLSTKLSVITMVTQISIHYFTEPAFYYWSPNLLPQHVSATRFLQLLSLLGYYGYSLYTPDSEGINWMRDR